MKRFQLILSLASVMVLTATLAHAEKTDDMTVTAEVSNNCTLAAGTMPFGSYDPVVGNKTADLDQTAALTITCTNGASASITIGASTNASGVGATLVRKMASGDNRLDYELYSDSARSVDWTDESTVVYDGTGLEETVTVYGRIPANQNVPAGSYTDTVPVTITY